MDIFKTGYSVGEIVEFSVVSIGEDPYYFVSTNGIIGDNQKMFVPTTEDFNTLVEIKHYFVPIYYTTSEREAVKFIESHYND